jgi:hypothetical protein
MVYGTLYRNAPTGTLSGAGAGVEVWNLATLQLGGISSNINMSLKANT